jgi:hypothetical protein
MALKSTTETRLSTRQNEYRNWACTAGGSAYITSYGITFTDVILNSKAVSLVTSVNNKRLRPWTSFSYRKMELWGNPGVRLVSQDVTCWYLGVPRTYRGVLQAVTYSSTAYSANNGTGWEGYTYTPLTTDCEAIVVAKITSALSDIRTQYNLLVTLGEANETRAHLCKTASRLYHGFLSFRKGNIVGAYKHLAGRKPVPVRKERTHRQLKRRAKDGSLLDDVSSGWMEFSYAWMPLISDMHSAAKYLAEKQVKSRFSVYQVSRKHALELDQKKVLTSDSGSNSYDFTHYNHHECNVKMTYEVCPAFMWGANTLDELGFKDPASLVWELLPLSFVVDWFINVGQVLESLHELKHWSVRRGLKATKIVNKMGKELTRQPVNPLVYLNFPWNAGVWQTFKRETVMTLPTSVPLRIKVDNPFDMLKGQMASAAVLLRYAFRQPASKR